MKRTLSILIILCISASMMAQVEGMYNQADSVLLEKITDLEKQVTRLRNSLWSLQQKVNKQEEELSVLREGIEQGKLSTEQANQAIGQLQADLASHQQASGERFESDEARMKKTSLLLLLVFGVLFLAMLILSIANRGRIRKDYLTLEAKVDNTREDMELEVKQVLKNHEKDIAELSATVEGLKKQG